MATVTLNGCFWVGKLNAEGTDILYSTHFGGSGFENSPRIGVDNFGNAYITGRTSSSDFPTPNGLDHSLGGGRDLIVAKIDASGILVYGSYLGGSDREGDSNAFDIAVDGKGTTYIVSETQSGSSFPTKNGLQNSPPPGGTNEEKAFLSVFDLSQSGNASLIYSTFLGGNDDTEGETVAIDTSSGIAYVAGHTEATDFPLKNPYQSTRPAKGRRVGFITAIDPYKMGDSSLVASTFVGNSGDEILDMSVDLHGNVYIVGRISLPDLSPSLEGAGALEILKFNPELTELIYFVKDLPTDDIIAVDPDGNAYIKGRGEGVNLLLNMINSDGTEVIYSFTIGPARLNSIAVDKFGNVYLTGTTLSDEFETLNAAQSNGESGDAFIVKVGEERELENTEPLANKDLLLVKNRWPTPGDQIDSIIFGQFGDTIPPKEFVHEICLSKDSKSDVQDISIFKKTFKLNDFEKLDPDIHEAIDEDTYLSYNIGQFYVDKPNDCSGNNCPEKIDLTAIDTGIYYVIFKSDSKNEIPECEEDNNTYPGYRIEIDNFNPGDCEVCPESVTDLQGNTWTLSTEFPNCDHCSLIYPPTSGKAYYDGQSYYASCVYERIGEDPIAVAWLRWQENKLAKDSLVFPNDEGDDELFFHFCRLDEFEDEFGTSVIPDEEKEMIGTHGHPNFPDDFGSDILDDLIDCYLDRAIERDSFCDDDKLKVPVIDINKHKIAFNVTNPKQDTIYIYNKGDTKLTLTEMENEGELDVNVLPEFTLPFNLNPGDSLLVRLKLIRDQNLAKDKNSMLRIKTGKNGIADSVAICLQKLILRVSKLTTAIDILDPLDTVYVGEGILFGVNIEDEYTGRVFEPEEPISIIAKTISPTTNGLQNINHALILHKESLGGIVRYVFYDAFKGLFNSSTRINNITLLSGQVAMKFEQNNGDLVDPIVVNTWYASPFDFYIESVDFQQGIVNQDKKVSLTKKQGVKKTFDPLPFIVDHDGHVEVKINMTNQANIDYRDIILMNKLDAIVEIFKDGERIVKLNLNRLLLKDNGFNAQFSSKGIIQDFDYKEEEVNCMNNVFNTSIKREYFRTPGMYTIKVKLTYPPTLPVLFPRNRDLHNDADEKINMVFKETNTLTVLVYAAATDGTKYVDFKPDSIFTHLRKAYPVQHDNIKLIDMGTYEFSSHFSLFIYHLEAQTLWYEYNRDNEKKADVAIFIGDASFANIICGNNKGAGCRPPLSTVAFSTTNIELISHEIGHWHGLNDTYEDGPVHDLVHTGEPNPIRTILGIGNPVEQGSIHLIEKKKALDFHKSFLFPYDFMGGGSGKKAWIDRITWDYLYHTYYKLNAKSKNAGEYLLVSGSIHKDQSSNLEPFSVTDNPPYVSESDPLGEYIILLKDNDLNILDEHRFNIEFSIQDAGEVDEVLFLFYIPFNKKAKSLELLFRDSLINSSTFSIESPEIIKFNADYDEETELFDFQWFAEDSDSDSLYYSLSYSPDGSQYFPIFAKSTSTTFSWDGDQTWFVQNEGIFRLRVSDGFNEDSEEISVEQVTTFTLEETYNNFNIVLSPHPVSHDIHLQFNTETRLNLTADILDINGVLLSRQSVSLVTGNDHIILDASHLRDGIYFVRLIDEKTGISSVLKVLKMSR